MRIRLRVLTRFLCWVLLLAVPTLVAAQPKDETPMDDVTTVQGEFEIKLTAQPSEGLDTGRMRIDKEYQGRLKATGQGEMLSFRSETPGSAGYVAIEKVSGVLDGRSGSFVLQHAGLMNRGESELDVTIIPDSGTEELTGISGQMEIDNSGGNHRYTLRYRLDPPSND